jgi:hypothetical protein
MYIILRFGDWILSQYLRGTCVLNKKQDDIIRNSYSYFNIPRHKHIANGGTE